MTPEDKDVSPTTRSTPDEGTGLPGFRTWRGVYLFVLGVFVVYVVLLTALTRAFQ